MKIYIQRLIKELEKEFAAEFDAEDTQFAHDLCSSVLCRVRRHALENGYPEIMELAKGRSLAQTRRALARCLETFEAPAELIPLATAADLLGYKPAGLRKVVKTGRIRHVQNGNGPIKFRREWIDEYIQANNPKGVERSPAKTKPKPPKSTIPGFNPKLFKT